MDNDDSVMSELDGKLVVSKPSLFSVIWGIVFLRWRSFANRRTLIKLFLAVSIFTVLAGLSINEFNQKQFEVWFFEVLTSTMMPLVCLSVAGSFLRTGIKESTIEYLWTRPIGKAKLMIGSYLSSIGIVVLFYFVFDISLHVIGFYRNIPNAMVLFPNLWLAQFMGVLAFCGIASFLSVFSGKYLLWGVVYGLLFEVGVSQIPTNMNNLSVSHHLSSIVWGGVEGLVIGTLGCLLTGGISLVLACYIFSFKQYRVGSSREG